MWRKFKWGISVECSRPMEQARARQEELSNLLMRHPQDMSWKPVGELQEKYGISKCVSIRPHDTWVILHTHAWSSLLMKWFEVTLISFTCYVHFCQIKMLKLKLCPCIVSNLYTIQWPWIQRKYNYDCKWPFPGGLMRKAKGRGLEKQREEKNKREMLEIWRSLSLEEWMPPSSVDDVTSEANENSKRPLQTHCGHYVI